MKIILDRVGPKFRHVAIQCAERYHLQYMYDGRKPGLRNCVIFSMSEEPALAVYHTKAGNITVRQGN